MTFDPGFDIQVCREPLGFRYGAGVFGPQVERRRLDAIRPSLRDSDCDGPDPVYVSAMDVGQQAHRETLRRHMLLYGVVAYAAGRLGREPVRSQGHVHRVSSHSGWRPPELYEIWSGTACIYMQEYAAGDPGRCFAVTAGPGGQVVVPPGWAHATISADPSEPLVFGAWCDREYGFEYDAIRARGGLAWFPILAVNGQLEWERNPRYLPAALVSKPPRPYRDLGLDPGVPIYTQFENAPANLEWVSDPVRAGAAWQAFVP